MVELDNKDEFSIDGYLKNALDTIIYNLENDWDFVIVISGDRMVRVGKSVLAMNVAAYLAHRLKTKFDLDNIFFESQDMIEAVQQMPKNSVILYDEGREGLAANKSMKRLQQDLLDYFAECGQRNNVFIVCLPDFFELKESFAVGRSECMINVYRKSTALMVDMYKEGKPIPVVRYDRGYFEFFSRNTKNKLFDIARSTHIKNYFAVEADFIGRFTNNYPVDEVAYRQKKADALARFRQKKADELKVTKYDVFRDKEILKLKDSGLTQREISDKLANDFNYPISQIHVGRIINKYIKGDVSALN